MRTRNKNYRVGVCLIATIGLVSVGATAAEPKPSTEEAARAAVNVALGKAVFVSSTQNEKTYSPVRVTDGKDDTRWASKYGGSPQWMYIDLFNPCTISRVVLKWEKAFAKSYAIQVSEDAQKWRDVYATTASKGGTEEIAIPATRTRYVRVYMTETWRKLGCCSLWECEIYGTESAGPPMAPARLRLDAPRTTASLNGTWLCEAVPAEAKDELPNRWVHEIPVPGLTDMAQIGYYGVEFDYVFHRRTFTIEGPVPPVVLLKIAKAFYGKKVWLNGKVVGEHQPNFTPAWFDLKPFLRTGGEVNELVVRIGTRGSQPKGYPTGSDQEKRSYCPGIYDDVSLILSGLAHIEHVRHKTDIANGQVQVQVSVKNYGTEPGEIPVSIEICEAASGRAAGKAKASLKLAAGAQGEVAVPVPVADAHLWTPDGPFLYEVTVRTPSDQFATRIGMREIVHDKAAGKLRLNGKLFTLRGTNFTFYRFFEDLERGSLPWDKEFARRVIRKHKALNMNSARFCISFPPEIWYDVCDEEGFLIQDEYPCWHVEEHVTADLWTSEVLDWLRERQNHPCIAIWDLSNESGGKILHEVASRCRSADLQARPWQYDAPGTDFSEVHPYLFRKDKNYAIGVYLMENQICKLADGLVEGRNRVINEYDWLWLNRDGTPAGLAGQVYKFNFPDGATERQRRDLFAKTTAWLTEIHRAIGAASVQQFVGLTSSGGWLTADNFVGKVADLKFDPLFEKMMRDAMAPVLVMIQTFRQEHAAGAKVTLPVLVVNDSDRTWSGTIKLRLARGTHNVWVQTGSVSDLEIGHRKQVKFDIAWPTEAGEYELVAEYVEKGVPVQSVRKIILKTDDQQK